MPPPPRPVRPPLRRPVPTVTADAEARKATWLAGAAVLLALFAPALEDDVLGFFGIATPAARAQRELALTLSRQNQKLRDLDQRLATATEQLSANRAEMRQSALHGSDGAAWGRLLSLGRLADALRGATPFASDLAVAQAVGGHAIDEFAEDVAKLAAYAGTGVPTLRDIDTEFHRIADDILHPKSGILPAVLVRNLTGWDQWTRPAPPPDPSPALVQAAAARLAEGDIEDAIARITQVGAPNDAAFAGWLEDARARVTADALVRRIDRTLGRLAHDLPQ